MATIATCFFRHVEQQPVSGKNTQFKWMDVT